jgi:hypothetical protein
MCEDDVRQVTVPLRGEVDRIVGAPEWLAGIRNPSFETEVTGIVQHGRVNNLIHQIVFRGPSMEQSLHTLQTKSNFFIPVRIIKILNMSSIITAFSVDIPGHW